MSDLLSFNRLGTETVYIVHEQLVHCWTLDIPGHLQGFYQGAFTILCMDRKLKGIKQIAQAYLQYLPYWIYHLYDKNKTTITFLKDDKIYLCVYLPILQGLNKIAQVAYSDGVNCCLCLKLHAL